MRHLLAQRWLPAQDHTTRVAFALPGHASASVDSNSGIPARVYASAQDGAASLSVSFAPLGPNDDVARSMAAYPDSIARHLDQTAGVQVQILDKQETTDQGYRALDFRIRFFIRNTIGVRVWAVHLVADGTTLIVEQAISYSLTVNDEPKELALVRALASKLEKGVKIP